jgi:lysophospholipase L1-like esterase
MVNDASGATTGLRTAVRGGMPLKLVIVLAGANDLACNDDPTVISDIIQALHRICHGEGVPHTLAVGIPPSGYQSLNEEAASLARTVNNQLKEYCQSESRASFVPFPFEYARDDEKWACDGLHLSAEGYRVLGLSLAPVVEQIIIVE